jgi:hypothetical protein
MPLAPWRENIPTQLPPFGQLGRASVATLKENMVVSWVLGGRDWPPSEELPYVSGSCLYPALGSEDGRKLI